MNHVPPHFAQTIIELGGDTGLAWLERLPELIAECERRWSLQVLPPVANLSYNYVAPAVQAGATPVMLKLGLPNPELLTEIEALRLYQGQGMARLLAADPEQGILLLEQLKPGTPLSQLGDDEQATSIAAGVMRQLWRPLPPGHPFPTLARWTAGIQRLRIYYDGGVGPFPAHLVEMAESLRRELLTSAGDMVLLHGDLHHDNILAATRQPWLAIDPKGVAGEPAYETSVLLYNSLPDPLQASGLEHLLARRVDQLAEEVELDRQRIVGWGVVQAVLSAWWGIEDHGRVWDETLICAEYLARL
ncbi:MAG: aminoglycoside phosphotransferase family protein [Chloroflexi bacterium]|nr:aminoglycoside phosphotransferase family protein [Chloroflexota bacterium]MCI0575599.1 aminoglycoside phosphotransferase family protein [Chloroflexota bacterium]MCI0645064.1 aminoglycoside phosphotransferase family protein [Chloroflexota bacterium]MCI0731900.1 aminoglycoside phosphotransferase family protein [Chloroflexota bacterium]